MLTRRKFVRSATLATLATETIGRSFSGFALTPPENGLKVFSQQEAEIVGAIAERIWPATEGDPGAIEAGVMFYIDRALFEAYPDLQNTYHGGIRSLNSYTMKQFGNSMAHLSEPQQDDILRNLEKNAAEVQPFFADPAAPDFFGLVLKHTREGLFSDPIYGGNRNCIGWKSIGYFGPRYYYTAEQQRTPGPLKLPMQSLADL